MVSAGITEWFLTVAESGTAILAVFFRSRGRDARAIFTAIFAQIAPRRCLGSGMVPTAVNARPGQSEDGPSSREEQIAPQKATDPEMVPSGGGALGCTRGRMRTLIIGQATENPGGAYLWCWSLRR